MTQLEKTKYLVDIIKFGIYLISLIILIMTAYNNLDKRLAVIETEMQHKVDSAILMQKLDMMKYDINQKIDSDLGERKRNR
jgi:uncharacterized protein YoxC